MWPFKKSKVIDFTSEKMKVPASMKARLEQEYKNLVPSTETNNSGSALGFLGSLAGSAESNLVSDEKDELNLKHLKVKIEDAEYKIENLSKRLNSILNRLDLAEKKIDRNERRV